MQLLREINHDGLSDLEITKLVTRRAARAFVFDADDNVALIHVAKYGYHKLPGGGVEPGETLLDTLTRECCEELGCNVEVFGEVGKIDSYRKASNRHDASHCYLARVVGEKKEPSFTEIEAETGFTILWLPFTEALQRLRSDAPSTYEVQFSAPRDLFFFEEALRILEDDK